MGAPSYPTLRLSRRLGRSWSNIEESREFSDLKLAELKEVLLESDSQDTSIVVSGSLGRGEFTPESDIDWYLLVDGTADPHHHDLFLDAEKKIKSFWPKDVGREGTFQTIVSSHDLIHNIGGEDDTNNNLTRRLLLLLESTPVGSRMVHERVVRNMLKRYLKGDHGFERVSPDSNSPRDHIPHFLLNDIARLWRTMAVDFAYKLRRRSGEKWAIRNIKLRMSRKLLYVAGLLACFRCQLDLGQDGLESVLREEGVSPDLLDFIDSIFSEKPLDIIATFAFDRKHLDDVSERLFGAYDEFLGILRNDKLRKHLEDLPEGSEDDDVYQKARGMSHRFRDALQELFFDNEPLDRLTRRYGVF
jgi:predicted nucleotidyltransferase